MSSYNDTNRNARIRNRVQRNGRLRTETARRDSGLSASINTDPRTDATRLSVTDEKGFTVRFDGRQARTLFRLLARHYEYTNKSVYFG